MFTHSPRKEEKIRQRFLLIKVDFKLTGKKISHVLAKKFRTAVSLSSSSAVSVSFPLEAQLLSSRVYTGATRGKLVGHKEKKKIKSEVYREEKQMLESNIKRPE